MWGADLGVTATTAWLTRFPAFFIGLAAAPASTLAVAPMARADADGNEEPYRMFGSKNCLACLPLDEDERVHKF